MKVHLIEGKCYYYLKNYEKAKTAVVCGRTAGNSIYLQPEIQVLCIFPAYQLVMIYKKNIYHLILYTSRIMLEVRSMKYSI